MTPTHASSQHLARAGDLIDEAGRLMREHRPLVETAALAVASAPFPVWVVDERGRVIGCNREFEAVVHATCGDLRGHTLAETVGANLQLTIEDDAVLATARSRRYSATIDGEGRQRQFLKWPLFSEDGRVIGVCGAMS